MQAHGTSLYLQVQTVYLLLIWMVLKLARITEAIIRFQVRIRIYILQLITGMLSAGDLLMMLKYIVHRLLQNRLRIAIMR